MTATFATKIAPKGHVTQMEHAGFGASLMRARRLTGNGVHGLPPGDRVPVYPIASLPGAPEGWVREAGTYVCPVSADWGLWFDWTMNDTLNTAVLPSVKGMNPITGQKLEALRLEQYKNKCPVHNVEFGHGRYCEKCDYKWPPQSYVCHPNIAWWDGFRQPDGSVRQFFFTEDEERDIASHVIGKKNTVPAFGFAFFKTKEPRTPPATQFLRGASGYTGQSGAGVYGVQGPQGWQGTGGPPMGPDVYVNDDTIVEFTCADVQFLAQSCEQEENTGGKAVLDSATSSNTFEPCLGRSIKDMGDYPPRAKSMSKGGVIRRSAMMNRRIGAAPVKKTTKSVSVGAGAKIRQDLTADPLDIEHWQEKESGLIRLYFCFKDQFQSIVNNGGIRDLGGSSEGYLDGLPVG